jgi:hypothetical protein
MRKFTLPAAGPLFALLVAGALGAAAPAMSQEQQLRAVARTGLHTLTRGHVAYLNLVDVGNAQTTEQTQVVLRFLDDNNRVVGRLTGVLRPGDALRLALPLPLGGNRDTLVVRAEATLVTPADNLGSRPILTLETFNQRTLDSFTTSECLIPWDPEEPGGRVGLCGDGCFVDVETIL